MFIKESLGFKYLTEIWGMRGCESSHCPFLF
nr:MAG TPA: hypothetical protein [Caudoviricetes sp.]